MSKTTQGINQLREDAERALWQLAGAGWAELCNAVSRGVYLKLGRGASEAEAVLACGHCKDAHGSSYTEWREDGNVVCYSVPAHVALNAALESIFKDERWKEKKKESVVILCAVVRAVAECKLGQLEPLK